MVKIAIMSDSHDNLQKINMSLGIIQNSDIDLIIHSGDFCSPYTAFPFKEISIPFIGVFGNNDGDKLNLRNKFKKIGKIYDYCHIMKTKDNKEILITHYPDMVNSLAKSQDFDYVVYGHTHRTQIENKFKTLVLNPGTLSGDLSDKCTFMILDTESNKVNIIEV